MNKNMELMKKLIEEKKKASNQGGKKRPEKNIGHSNKAFHNNKKGGLFD